MIFFLNIFFPYITNSHVYNSIHIFVSYFADKNVVHTNIYFAEHSPFHLDILKFRSQYSYNITFAFRHSNFQENMKILCPENRIE